ncbi:MAG: AAA family ATPase [Schwartzia sp.]|nr:AAA family ATPase [Schwartzia sp. (in: firmicutes)]
MPVGVDDFKYLRERYYFVDKTRFIQELIDGHSKVTLITRPRRFGKTLTLSMLYYFFTRADAEENGALFDGCAIAGAGEEYMAEQGKYPVIFLSLKDVKADSWDSCLTMLRNLLAGLYDGFPSLHASQALSEREQTLYREILFGQASPETCMDSLRLLTVFLEKHFRQRPILLLDEYDAPIQSAWEHGYYDQAIGFFRNFLSSALKTNPALDFAVLTGVLRIAKESIFRQGISDSHAAKAAVPCLSALNNLDVSSVISGPYADVMGFTPEEVRRMADDLGQAEKLDEIRDWYDGYNFSGHEIYNPWSVINYFSRNCKAGPYWVNTSGNSILAELLEHADETQERNLYKLLRMETISTQIKESVIYSDIYRDREALYTMLLTTGYLKVVPGIFDGDAEFCAVAIPNQEVRRVYASEVVSRLQRLGTRPNPAAFMESLLTGQAEDFSRELASYLETVVSYYDTLNHESFYHGFMLGMLALLVPRFQIRSNRESGYGRFDLAAFPKRKEQAGILMEFKVAKTEEDLPQEAAAALRQIEGMDYLAEFRAQGIEHVWRYGVAFCGKKVKLIAG